MKILIAIAVVMTLITPSAGTGRVLAAEQDTLPVMQTESSESDVPADNGNKDSDTSADTDADENKDEDKEKAEDYSGSDYHEWQTDTDEYDADEMTEIVFILRGAESVNAAIDSDYDAEESGIEYDEVIRNGDKRELARGSSVRIQGISGSYIRAAYGSTENEAVNNPDPEISGEGKSVSIAQDGSGYIYIKVAQKKEDIVDENTNTCEIADDEEGTITYSDVSVEKAKEGSSQNSFPKTGQVFTGMATLRDNIPRRHGSVGYMDPDNGWLKENTTLKSIAAVCISGPSKSLGSKNTKFIYSCKILSADPKTGKIKVGITFKPVSNKLNLSKGILGTQVMYKSTFVTLHPRTGYLTLMKKQTAESRDYLKEYPANYSLEGARYRLYTDAACTSQAKDADGNVIELTTKDDGTTNVIEIEPGTYYVKEISASKGFLLDKKVRSVTVSTDNTLSSPATVISEEKPGYTNLKMILVKENDNYGYKRLAGARYELSYYETDPDDPVINDSTLKASWIYETRYMETPDGIRTAGIDFAEDEPVSGKSYTEDSKRVLPIGVIKLREIKAPKGLAVDKRVHTGTVRLDGDSTKLSVNGQDSLTVRYGDRLTHEEEYKSISLAVRKVDAETGQPAAEGRDRKYSAGSLAGAVYEVYFEDNDLDKNVKVGEIVTDKDGHGTLDKDSRTGDKLKPGRYFIEEKKASPGYATDRFSERNAVNRYEDGKHVVSARADLDNGITVYEYQITSHEMHHETYISKTDAVTSEELPGAKLQVINADGNIVEEWVSGSEPHLIKALPDGKYTLREITAPYGYDIAEDAEFEVKADKVANKIEMKNKPVTIATQAADSATSSHAGILAQEEKITDKVALAGLIKGRKYKVTGKLVDKDTGEAVENAGAEQEFEAVSDEMTIDLEFTVDSSAFTKESSLVAFEKLYRLSKVHDIEGETVPVELQKHEDPDDEDQTVHYGGIAYTEATGEDGKHLITGDRDSLIIDTVAYRNLSVKEEYRLEGELYDQTAGKLLGITSSAVFTPSENDGTTELQFRADTGSLANHAIVVFERLYSGSVLIDEHCDPEDKAQTVYVTKEPEKSPAPKTGDDNLLKIYAIITVLAVTELIFIYAARRRAGRRYRR